MTAFFSEEKLYNSGEVVVVRVYDATVKDIMDYLASKNIDPARVSVDPDCDCASGDWIEPTRAIELSWRT